VKLQSIGLGVILLAASVVIGARPAGSDDGLVVHEWGTFLSMNGSDGISLDGMYHEEHALPGFVHARSKDQLHLPATSLKGETPVIYFYTDRPQNVSVTVRFPKGIWTQWYPQAERVGPKFGQVGSHLNPEKGQISWDAKIVPAIPGESGPTLPQTSLSAPRALIPCATSLSCMWRMAKAPSSTCRS
jgi:hypothetical protein